MSKQIERVSLIEALQATAMRLDELSIDPAANESQSRAIAAAVRCLIPAFTPRMPRDLAALGDVLASHESTLPELDEGVPPSAAPEAPPAAGRRKPKAGRRKPKAQQNSLLHDLASLDPKSGCGEDAKGHEIPLIKMLALAYFRSMGHSVAFKGKDAAQSAGFAGISMALKCVLLMMVCDQRSAAGLGALQAWSGLVEVPNDWQQQLSDADVPLDLLGMTPDELGQTFPNGI